MIWLIFIAVFIIFYYYVIHKPYQTWKIRKVPFLKPWPVVGNMGPALFRQTSLTETVQNWYNAAEGKYVGVFQFLLPSLMIRDVELIKRICVKEFDNFMDRRIIISEDIDPLFGNVLLSMRGQKWKHMRATLSPAFTGSKMRSMFNLMSDCGEKFVGHFVKTADRSKPLTIEMKDFFTRYANDVIASCAFGVQCDSIQDKNNEFYMNGKMVSNFSGSIQSLKFFGYTISPFLMQLFCVKLFSDDLLNFFRDIVHTTMKTREEQLIYRPDMIQLLMQARKGQLKHEESGKNNEENNTGFATVEESHIGKGVGRKGWTDDEITAQAFIFFLAGFDSISTMMCHMAYELALNLDVQEKLQAEIDNTLDDGNKLTYELLMKMKYLDMVVSETLRKWPAATFIDRLCTKSITIESTDPNESPLHLEKGDSLLLPIFGIHRDAQYYPSPERFDPERFSDENKDKINPNAYIPFGIGPRNCIGSRFALLEMKTIFVNVLRKFDFVVDKKTKIPLKLSRSDFNLMAEGGFWLALKLRNS